MWLRKKSNNVLSLEDASELDFIDRKALSPLEKLEREETHQFIRKAIDSLSERNRLAVTLFYMDGLSYKKFISSWTEEMNSSDIVGIR